jgi:HSP20 family protein
MTMYDINRWDPLNQLREEMGRLYEGFTTNWPAALRFGALTGGTFPALNLWEDATKVYAEAELPGLKLGDLEINVVGNELTVRGERKDEHRETAMYHRRERGIGTFTRVIRLPVEINAEQVEATLKNGILTVVMPKAERARPRKIEVKVATK